MILVRQLNILEGVRIKISGKIGQRHEKFSWQLGTGVEIVA